MQLVLHNRPISASPIRKSGRFGLRNVPMLGGRGRRGGMHHVHVWATIFPRSGLFLWRRQGGVVVSKTLLDTSQPCTPPRAVVRSLFCMNVNPATMPCCRSRGGALNNLLASFQNLP